MNFLKKLHPHMRDYDVYLNEKDHIYTIKGESNYTSVTTFVNSLFEKFNADAIIDNMMSSSRWPSNKYYGMTKPEIKNLWNKNGSNASEAGTNLHLDIEKYYNGVNVDNDSDEFKYFLEFALDYKKLIPYRTEQIIYSKEYRLAGSVDMLFINSQDGEEYLDIYDWKRVKEVVKHSKWNKWIQSDVVTYLPDTNYWHYALQLNIYKAIYNRSYDKKVRNLYLVCLHPDNKSYIRIPVVDLQEEVHVLLNKSMNKKSKPC